jgi:hypothetical protein
MAVSDWVFREISGLAGETAERHKSDYPRDGLSSGSTQGIPGMKNV